MIELRVSYYKQLDIIKGIRIKCNRHTFVLIILDRFHTAGLRVSDWSLIGVAILSRGATTTMCACSSIFPTVIAFLKSYGLILSIFVRGPFIYTHALEPLGTSVKSRRAVSQSDAPKQSLISSVPITGALLIICTAIESIADYQYSTVTLSDGDWRSRTGHSLKSQIYFVLLLLDSQSPQWIYTP